MFVDYDKGSDNSTCGQPLTPCKTLSMAVDQSSDQSTIKIIGKQYISESIELRKSLTFEGVGGSFILPLNNKVSLFAFEIPSVSLNVSFVSLHLRGIGLLKNKYRFLHSMIVVIHSCSFEEMGINRFVIIFGVYRFQRSGSFSLVISNSSFTNLMNVFRVNIRTPILTMKDCLFRNINKLGQLRSLRKFYLLNSTFQDVKTVTMQSSYWNKRLMAILSGCHFSNIDGIRVNDAKVSVFN